jgi:hypothetical protein
VQSPSLDGSPSGVVANGFSAVAVTQTMEMFVIGKVDGVINEYQTNSSNPFQWDWQGVVDVPGADGEEKN